MNTNITNYTNIKIKIYLNSFYSRNSLTLNSSLRAFVPLCEELLEFVKEKKHEIIFYQFR